MTLEVQSLAVRRGGRLVFRNISFALAPGAALFVTGPNGSGKSSLLRAIAGLIEKDVGDILWQAANVDADREGQRRRTALIGHLDALKPELTAAETLSYWRALMGASGQGEPANILEPLGLSHLTDATVRVFSAGQKRRLALARLLLSERPLWLLDEPAAALDAEGQKLLAGLIARHRQKGGIAVIVTHHAADITDAKHLTLCPA